MIFVALLMISSPALDQWRCQQAHQHLERQLAEFNWLLVRAEQRQWFTDVEARRIRLDAELVTRPYLDNIRDIAPTARGEECEMISNEGWDDLVEDVIVPYRDLVNKRNTIMKRAQ